MSEGTGVVPRFESLFGRSGLHVRDPIEDVQAQLYTDGPVDPTPASTEDFVYPVDTAVSVTATRLRTPFLLNVWVRDMEGNVVAEFTPNNGSVEVPVGSYSLELDSLPMKLYARVDDAGFHVVPGEESVDILLDPDTTVRVGARSFHSQPGRTLTTTSDPRDLMEAVSLFGNAMKTWSPERTFPTLRGHPPLLELDGEPDLPDGAAPPDNGIRLTVPETHEWLYPAVPLAYWLGATVEPGPPALHVDGWRYPLGTAGGYDADTDRRAFEHHVRDVLQFTFQFDCAARGFYDVELDVERRIEASDLSLDVDRLAEVSLAERTRRYLEVGEPLDRLADEIGRPDWRLTADVEPEPSRATTTPFLARDLAVVRCPSDAVLTDAKQAAPANVFTRSAGAGGGPATGDSDSVLTRSSSSSEPVQETTTHEEVIDLPEADSMSQAWVGDGFAVGAAKATTKSYLQRLEKQVEGNSRIEIDVVVNDAEMAEEADVSDIYGTRDHLDFDINLQRDLTTSELADVFERDTDFVHYIGHVDPEGFDCADGHLDAAQIGDVGADTFVLNACSSYGQGQRLVDSGAIAGVVTLKDVINSMATKIGRKIARLLNYGFPIGSATNLIQETMFSGEHYAVVGDSNATVAQSTGGVPNVQKIELDSDGRFRLRIEAFASWDYGIGAMFTPYLDAVDRRYVVPGELGPWTIDSDTLADYLDHGLFPIISAGEFHWSDNVSVSELRSRLKDRRDDN
ncbi:hypothetical protein [Natronomonas marina]|jgi:hypothetical protein|uniref:hypothetical protein n=1 Tax=Natronomonas marina TaxID=2961939 RepID=UPI0020C9B8D0|nr:hypothetical protein [Natronomonas marina]